MSKCIGCGSVLQDEFEDLIGYTKCIDNKLCERCFRINNYNEYKFVNKSNEDYISILKKIDNKSLVVLVVDLFNISYNLCEINKYLQNNILLVLTKRDIIPKSFNDSKIIDYFLNNYKLNIVDKVIISSKNNYNMDLLYEKIIKYKTDSNVYFIGFTNSGKSSLINKLIYNYTDISSSITTSNLPSTTIDSITIKINDDLTLIDTPGLLDSGDIINYIDSKLIKKLIPQKELKPITYQVKGNQTILIESILRIDCTDNFLTLYISNNLNITRLYKNTNKLNNLVKHEFDIENKCDIVIQGLGFINIQKQGHIIIYAPKLVNVYVRNSLI